MTIQPTTAALLDKKATEPAYDFDAALRRRLSLISDYNNQQSTYAFQQLANRKYAINKSNPGTVSAYGDGGAVANDGSLRSKIVANAASRIGSPYVWGGESLAEGGFDCSGLVYDAYKNAGINVSRQTAAGFARSLGKVAPINTLQPGDLVAWGSSPSTAHHIAVYAGNGQIIEAPRRGVPVRRSTITGRDAFGIKVTVLG